MRVIIVGSGIAGLTAAIKAAELDCAVVMASPYVPERSQSIMAAGGINAALDNLDEGDSVELHIEDTLKAGAYLESEESVCTLCEAAPGIIEWLDSIGVLFSRTKDGRINQRAFGGQSRKRTAYAGTSTGKQIVTALTQKCREYEIKGLIERRTGLHFHSALIDGGRCYGAVFTDDVTEEVVPMYADAVIMATGGMNALFGKTTGSELCDGYAASMLMTEGVSLRNLEFIQIHPTTIETTNKRMLISEAARGEGGRLYYEEHGKRVYFMEDKYGEHGNLMPRDIVSRCMYRCPSQVYLDVTFLGAEVIHDRLEEVREICEEYLGIDICKTSIPVVPSVHFFMGGIKVSDDHETSIKALYAAGECASKYHGANRLGGNSLLAAIYGSETAAKSAVSRYNDEAAAPDFTGRIEAVKKELAILRHRPEGNVSAENGARGRRSGRDVRKQLEDIINRNLGIERAAKSLNSGIREIDSLMTEAAQSGSGGSAPLYEKYRRYHMLLLAKALLMCALSREESRGAHYRSDFPETNEAFRKNTIVDYRDGEIHISYENPEDGTVEKVRADSESCEGR